MRAAWLLAGLMLAGPVLATEPPLTLETALAAVDAPHPDLDLVRAQGDAAQAEAQLAASLNDLRMTLDAGLRSGRNRAYGDRFHPDNYVRLNARKTLLDAGRQAATLAAAREDTEARGLGLMDARSQRRVAIMARYFDVLLADMGYNAETEFLAVAYTSWDHAKDRAAQGQVSPPELAELEARYLDSLARRNDIRRRLREKRQLLGAALNQPGPVQAELADPALADNARALPEHDVLLNQVLAQNPRLLAQKRLLAAAGKRLEAVRADDRPSLEVEAEAAQWSRDTSTRDDLRAGLNLVWPIWQGGRQDARMAREQALFHELQARHDRLLMDLRQAVADLREEIETLRDSERRQAEVHARWRDLALDKARAEYELELKANIGTSMAETQMAKLRRRSVEYRLALAWARLDALLGGPMASVKGDKK